MMTWDVLVQQWWVQATSAIAAALVVAAILAIFSRRVRDRFWKPIGHFLHWPLTLRITTAAQVKEAGKAVAALEGENDRLRVDVEKARADVEKATNLGAAHVAATQALARQELEAAESRAKQAALDQVRRGGELAETARELGRSEGRAEAMAEVATQRATPQLRPTWRIVEIADGHFDLRNSQGGINPKDIQDVSIEAPMLDFAFDGSNQWPGYFPGMVGFEGRRVGRLDVRFVVRWRDSLGDPRAGEAILEAKPRRAVIL